MATRKRQNLMSLSDVDALVPVFVMVEVRGAIPRRVTHMPSTTQPAKPHTLQAKHQVESHRIFFLKPSALPNDSMKKRRGLNQKLLMPVIHAEAGRVQTWPI